MNVNNLWIEVKRYHDPILVTAIVVLSLLMAIAIVEGDYHIAALMFGGIVLDVWMAYVVEQKWRVKQ